MCLDCDGEDPLKSAEVAKLLTGELKPLQQGARQWEAASSISSSQPTFIADLDLRDTTKHAPTATVKTGNIGRRRVLIKSCVVPFIDENGCLTDEGNYQSYHRGAKAHAAVEILLKGPEQRLPTGLHFIDKDGTRRE